MGSEMCIRDRLGSFSVELDWCRYVMSILITHSSTKHIVNICIDTHVTGWHAGSSTFAIALASVDHRVMVATTRVTRTDSPVRRLPWCVVRHSSPLVACQCGRHCSSLVTGLVGHRCSSLTRRSSLFTARRSSSRAACRCDRHCSSLGSSDASACCSFRRSSLSSSVASVRRSFRVRH